MSQTSITQDPPVAKAGHVADIRPRTIGSYISAEEGPDATGATLVSSVDETYDLADGDTLVVRINGEDHTLTVETGDVSDIDAVTIAELIALVATDLPGVVGTDDSGLRLTTENVGDDATLQIIGGNIQDVLLFPTTEATGDDGTLANLDFGLGVVTDVRDGKDAADIVRSPKASATTGLVFKGVAILDSSREQAVSEVLADVADYPAHAQVPVLEKGCIWVNVEEEVNESSEVHMRVIAAGPEVAGHFRGSADASDCLDLSTRCRWRSRTTGAGLAILEIL